MKKRVTFAALCGLLTGVAELAASASGAPFREAAAAAAGGYLGDVSRAIPPRSAPGASGAADAASAAPAELVDRIRALEAEHGRLTRTCAQIATLAARTDALEAERARYGDEFAALDARVSVLVSERQHEREMERERGRANTDNIDRLSRENRELHRTLDSLKGEFLALGIKVDMLVGERLRERGAERERDRANAHNIERLSRANHELHGAFNELWERSTLAMVRLSAENETRKDALRELLKNQYVGCARAIAATETEGRTRIQEEAETGSRELEALMSREWMSVLHHRQEWNSSLMPNRLARERLRSQNIAIPDAAIGAEAVYERFLKIKLCGVDYSQRPIETTMAKLANPLSGKLHLDGFTHVPPRDGRPGTILRINDHVNIITGSPALPGNDAALDQLLATGKTVMYIAPRFLVERELNGRAAHLRFLFDERTDHLKHLFVGWPIEAEIGIFLINLHSCQQPRFERSRYQYILVTPRFAAIFAGHSLSEALRYEEVNGMVRRMHHQNRGQGLSQSRITLDYCGALTLKFPEA